MKLWVKITIAIFCTLIIAAIIFAFRVYHELMGGQTVRFDKPMTYAEATNAGFDFPLPISSHNVAL
jgi:hypothetical protein